MPDGWCTLEDVRRTLRSANLPGDISQDKAIAVDGIVAQTNELERMLSHYWYADPGDPIVSEATEVTIPTAPDTRDDEHDIPRWGAFVDETSERRYRYRHRDADAALGTATPRRHSRRLNKHPKYQIKTATGEYTGGDDSDDGPVYTRIQFARRYVKVVNELHVLGADGSFTDWVASSDYDGGVGPTHRGDDYWVRINSGGVSELNIDVHALDDEITSLSNAVIVDFDHGEEGIPRDLRRAVALRAAAELVDDPAFTIPDNAQVRGVDSLADKFESRAEELLGVYR